ncbi:MAG: hypothetical protein AB7H43_04540 [Acidimicrobiia bacterium]
MPHQHKAQVADHLEGWSLLAADGPVLASGLASSPLAVPAFFLGWIGFGMAVGRGLGRRGHDRQLMTALGAGLGPLMLVVGSEARRREGRAVPLVLSPGIDRGGDLDVLVLVQHDPDHVRSLLPTIEAVAPDVGTLTLARAVAYEWLEDDPDGPDDNDVVSSARSALVAARELVPITSPRLVVFPGSADMAVRRFAESRRRTLALFAVDDATAASNRG